MRTAAVLGLLLVHAPSARADLPRGAPSARSVSASARVLGCSPYVVLPCDGITSNRLGATVTLLAWRLPEGRGLFGMSLIAAAPTDADITAQVIAVVGYEQRIGARNWIRAGAGLAAARVAPGPPTMATSEVVDTTALPAIVVGGDAVVYLPLIERVKVAVDLGTALDQRGARRVQQFTASLSRKF